MRPQVIVCLLAVLTTSAFSGPSPAPAPPPPPHARIATLYRMHCASCHGDKGDGNGPASVNQIPRPRDFAEGEFKLRSTETGDIPTDGDLESTVRRGIPGTAMPAFGSRLTDEETRAVISVMKSFSPRFDVDGPGMPLELMPRPPRDSGAVGRGLALYGRLDCARCHGPTGSGDGPAAGQLRDASCFLTRPRDLGKSALYKAGSTPADVFRTLATGMDGTPMKPLHKSVPDAQLWDLAYYVSSLAH